MFKDPYQIQKLLNTKNNTFTYYSLTELEKQGHGISKLPFSIPILLENALRNFDNFAGTLDEKTKQLIAVAIAHVTQCPYCIKLHSKYALRKEASKKEITEAIWVAAKMRAGAAMLTQLLRWMKWINIK